MCWFYRDEPWPESYVVLSWVPFAAMANDPKEFPAVVKRELIDSLGAAGYLTRLCIDLRTSPENQSGLECLDGALKMACLVLNLRHGAFSPHFHSTGFARTLCESMSRSRMQARLQENDSGSEMLFSALRNSKLRLLTFVLHLNYGEWRPAEMCEEYLSTRLVRLRI